MWGFSSMKSAPSSFMEGVLLTVRGRLLRPGDGGCLARSIGIFTMSASRPFVKTFSDIFLT